MTEQRLNWPQFRSNGQEIDMEFLSSNITNTSQPVFLVMQTPESVAAGDNAAGTDTYRTVDLGFQPSNGLHEYRFDWLPNKTSFYADGIWIQDLVYTYPQMPGQLVLNHWSNGNSDWSQGPPLVDAVLTVAYVKAYFNSSDPSRLSQYAPQCNNTLAAGKVCEVPGLTSPPTPNDSFAPWFNRGMCGEQVNAPTATTTTIAATPVRSMTPPHDGPTSGGSKLSPIQFFTSIDWNSPQMHEYMIRAEFIMSTINLMMAIPLQQPLFVPVYFFARIACTTFFLNSGV